MFLMGNLSGKDDLYRGTISILWGNGPQWGRKGYWHTEKKVVKDSIAMIY